MASIFHKTKPVIFQKNDRFSFMVFAIAGVLINDATRNDIAQNLRFLPMRLLAENIK